MLDADVELTGLGLEGGHLRDEICYPQFPRLARTVGEDVERAIWSREGELHG